MRGTHVPNSRSLAIGVWGCVVACGNDAPPTGSSRSGAAPPVGSSSAGSIPGSGGVRYIGTGANPSNSSSTASCAGTQSFNIPITPVELDSGAYTYSLTESTPELALFTTPATHRLTIADRAPSPTRSGLSISAAMREFELVQLVLGPAAPLIEHSVTTDIMDGSLSLVAVGGLHGLGTTPIPSSGT